MGQISNLEGQTIDSKTNLPILFAHVALKGTNVGTISNEEGYFSLKANFDNDVEITFSSVGYATRTISVNRTQTQESIKVLLKPMTIELSEIVVRPEAETAKLIVEKAYASIDQNYWAEGHSLTGYLKESENTDGQPLYIAEAVLQADMPVLNSKEKIQTFHLKSRKKEFPDLEKHDIVFKTGGSYVHLRSPVVIPFKPMIPGRFKHFDYSIESYSVYNNKEIVIIAFTNLRKELEHGRFIIDLESFAFIGVEITEVFGIGIPFEDWKWISKFKTWNFEQDDISGKWFLSSSLYDGKWIKKKTEREFFTKSLYVTTDYSKTLKPVEIDPFKERFDFYGSATDFDPGFWEDFNYLKLNESEEKALFKESEN